MILIKNDGVNYWYYGCIRTAGDSMMVKGSMKVSDNLKDIFRTELIQGNIVLLNSMDDWPFKYFPVMGDDELKNVQKLWECYIAISYTPIYGDCAIVYDDNEGLRRFVTKHKRVQNLSESVECLDVPLCHVDSLEEAKRFAAVLEEMVPDGKWCVDDLIEPVWTPVFVVRMDTYVYILGDKGYCEVRALDAPPELVRQCLHSISTCTDDTVHVIDGTRENYCVNGVTFPTCRDHTSLGKYLKKVYRCYRIVFSPEQSAITERIPEDLKMEEGWFNYAKRIISGGNNPCSF